MRMVTQQTDEPHSIMSSRLWKLRETAEEKV